MTHTYERGAQTDAIAVGPESSADSDTDSSAASPRAEAASRSPAAQTPAREGGGQAVPEASPPAAAPPSLSEEAIASQLSSEPFGVFLRNAAATLSIAMQRGSLGDGLSRLLSGTGGAAGSDATAAPTITRTLLLAPRQEAPQVPPTLNPKVPHTLHVVPESLFGQAAASVTQLVPCPSDPHSFLALYTPRAAAGQAEQGGAGATSLSALHSTGGRGGGSASVAALWSLAAPAAPAAVCRAGVPITCAAWHAFQPKLVLGGTSTGQVLVWDVTGPTHRPTHSSRIGGDGHVHPVQAVAVSGTANAHNILSVSADGQACVWAEGDLRQPLKAGPLRGRKGVVPADVAAEHLEEGWAGAPAVRSLDVPLAPTTLTPVPTDASRSSVGTQDGALYHIVMSAGRVEVEHCVGGGSEAVSGLHIGYSPASKYWEGPTATPGHCGLITSMARHPGHPDNALLGDVLLTAGSDWTVRVWSPRLADGPLATLHAAQAPVLAVAWSRAAPCLCLAGDSAGHLYMWDLPAALGKGSAAKPLLALQVSTAPLTSLLWLPGKAGEVLVGDAAGCVHALDVTAATARAVGGTGTALLDALADVAKQLKQT